MKKQILIPLILSIVGLAFIAGGLIAYFVIPIAVKQQLKDTLIINSPSAKGYGGFMDARSGENGGGGRFISYTIFNLTNADAFSKGTEFPNFQAVGPFVYIQRTQKSEVRFLKGGAQVRYKGQATVTYVPSKSGGLDDTIMNLYMVNPSYVAAVNSMGADLVSFSLAANALKILYSQVLRVRLGFTTNSSCVVIADMRNAVLCTYFNRTQDRLADEVTGNNILLYFTNATNIDTYIRSVKAFDFNKLMGIFQSWGVGISGPAIVNIYNYLNDAVTIIISGNSAPFGGSEYGLSIYSSSARLFLFGENPLLKNLMANPGNRMFNNESADNISSYYTAYTGQANDQDTNGQHFSEYANITEITAYPFNYSMDFRVGGIPSFLSSPPAKAGFYYDLIQRTIPTNNAGSFLYKGLPVQVYTVDSKSLGAIDANYNNVYEGFFSLSSVRSDSLLYICTPFFEGIDRKYSSMMTGMNSSTISSTQSSFLIEPVTGLTVQSTLIFQLNVKIDFTRYNYNGILTNKLGAQDIIYPLLLMNQSQQMSTQNLLFVKNLVVNTSLNQILIFGILVSMGILFIILSLIYIMYRFCCRNYYVQYKVKEGKSNPENGKNTIFYNVRKEENEKMIKNDKSLAHPCFVAEGKEVPGDAIGSCNDVKGKFSEAGIRIVMEHSNVTRSQAIEALGGTEGDVVDAINNTI